MGAALVAMVAGGAPAAEGGARDVRARAAQLQERLLRWVDEDAAAYTAVIAALRLPKGSDAEKARRREARDRAYAAASEVPLGTAEACVEVLAAAAALVPAIAPQYASDLATGAHLAHGGASGALLNLETNLPHVKDPAVAARLRERGAPLRGRADTLRDDVLQRLADVRKSRGGS
jgi:glutamate formiminotransferase/formiminotetrahydrofolate cyclodeaminase